MKNALNYLGFALGWYALVKYGDIAIPLVVLYLLVHILFQKQKKAELITILSVSTIGLFADIMLTSNNVLQFDSAKYLPPPWFAMLWPLFTSMLNHCLKIFARVNWVINAVLGAVGGPLAYYIGDKINDAMTVDFNRLYLISVAWAILFVVAVKIASAARAR